MTKSSEKEPFCTYPPPQPHMDSQHAPGSSQVPSQRGRSVPWSSQHLQTTSAGCTPGTPSDQGLHAEPVSLQSCEVRHPQSCRCWQVCVQWLGGGGSGEEAGQRLCSQTLPGKDLTRNNLCSQTLPGKDLTRNNHIKMRNSHIKSLSSNYAHDKTSKVQD